MLPLPTANTSLDLGNSLPNEILGAIFDCLSRDALTRVSLVSRRWRANAERILYSTIIIHEVLPRASPAVAAPAPAAGLEEHEHKDFFLQTTMMMPAVPFMTLRCCETLSTRPRLAEYVRRFHLRWDTDAVECPLLLLRIAHDIARTLVPTLVHLDSLELSFGLAEALTSTPHSPHHSLEYHHPSPPAPPDTTQKPHSTPQFQQQQQQQQHPRPHDHHLLPPIRLPSLRTLALHGLGSPPPIELEHLLRRHPALQHLRLGDYHRALCLAPADVPHLRSFRGCPATAASVLPGRPVQALGLVGGCRCGCELATEEALLARIAAGSVPVRALDLSGMCVTPALLRSVSRHLSHVEWLKVRLALRHTLHYALSGSIRLLAALTTVLAAFYNLRGLDLSPTRTMVQQTASVAASAGQQQNAVEEQHLCITWMGACPSLRRVVFPSQTEWSLSEAGTWISGSGSSGSLPRWCLATRLPELVDPVHG